MNEMNLNKGRTIVDIFSYLIQPDISNIPIVCCHCLCERYFSSFLVICHMPALYMIIVHIFCIFNDFITQVFKQISASFGVQIDRLRTLCHFEKKEAIEMSDILARIKYCALCVFNLSFEH